MNTSAKASPKPKNPSCSIADGSQKKSKTQVVAKSTDKSTTKSTDKSTTKSTDKSTAKTTKSTAKTTKSTDKSTDELPEDLDAAFEDSWNDSSVVEVTTVDSIVTEPEVKSSGEVYEKKALSAKPITAVNTKSMSVTKSDSVELSDNQFDDSWKDENVKTVTSTATSTATKVKEQPVSKLKAFLNNSEPPKPGVFYNKNEKIQHIREQGAQMISDFTERGIEVSGIDSDVIIKEWSDMKYIDDDFNQEYIDNMITSIEDHGFESPRPIQSVTIGQIAKKGDIIVQAKAGNGKTCAFVVGGALRVNPRLYKTQLLILSPTQLLTDQTMQVVQSLTSKTGIVVHCYRGGLPHPRDGKTPQIVVGCPGRIRDLINRKRIGLDHIKTVILDEGDELLRQGFREQIKDIIENLNETVQICLFSATLPKGILELCSRFMRDPAYVILPENQVITELVTQWYVKCSTVNEKDGSVVDIIENNPKETIIIFFNSCTRLQRISEILSNYSDGKSISYLCVHSKMEPADRARSIADFSAGKCKVLLASDMASRGLDIPSVTLVINYDIPFAVETYVHRIGRSGRGDRLGNSVTLIMSEEDKQKITFIVQIHGIPIKVLKSISLESKPSNSVGK
jgi:superfamily II DNA/RNA helicase